MCTLLGRQRQLPDAAKKGPGTGAAVGHALRAAINTPVQGSAADVATAAMISINNCQRLKELGWKLLLQVRGLLPAVAMLKSRCCGRAKSIFGICTHTLQHDHADVSAIERSWSTNVAWQLAQCFAL